jgi:hypothetical protein
MYYKKIFLFNIVDKKYFNSEFSKIYSLNDQHYIDEGQGSGNE